MTFKQLLLRGTPLTAIPGGAVAAGYGAAYKAYPENIGNTMDSAKSLEEINNNGDEGYVLIRLDDGLYKIGLSCPNGGVFKNQCGQKGK